MKELTIEEKAKRYDEAIERVNSKWHYKNQPCVIDVSEIFPELKEFKDEDVRKWLIGYFQEYKSTGIEGFANGLKIDSIVAWLERQINNEDIHLLKLKAKAYDNAKERMSYAYNQNRVPIGFISEIFPNLYLYKTQDKIESKFKKGDWIIFNGLTLYIKEVVQGYYRTISKNGIPNSYDWNIDNAARLWTIESAKDGDVLCTYECGEPKIVFILKGTPKIPYVLRYYCYYNIMYPYFESETGCLAVNKEDIKPATKEQRDLLFAKMKEAGYKWDKDKNLNNLNMTQLEIYKRQLEIATQMLENAKNHNLSLEDINKFQGLYDLCKRSIEIYENNQEY